MPVETVPETKAIGQQSTIKVLGDIAHAPRERIIRFDDHETDAYIFQSYMIVLKFLDEPRLTLLRRACAKVGTEEDKYSVVQIIDGEAVTREISTAPWYCERNMVRHIWKNISLKTS